MDGNWEISDGEFVFAWAVFFFPPVLRRFNTHSSRYIFPFYLFHYRASRFSSAQTLINAIPRVNYPSFRISAHSNHFIIIISFFCCRDSAVGIAAGYGLDDRGAGVQVPVGSRIFSSPRRSDRLWGPPSLLFNSSRG
jgi:hypothetical protein